MFLKTGCNFCTNAVLGSSESKEKNHAHQLTDLSFRIYTETLKCFGKDDYIWLKVKTRRNRILYTNDQIEIYTSAL